MVKIQKVERRFFITLPRWEVVERLKLQAQDELVVNGIDEVNDIVSFKVLRKEK